MVFHPQAIGPIDALDHLADYKDNMDVALARGEGETRLLMEGYSRIVCERLIVGLDCPIPYSPAPGAGY